MKSSRILRWSGSVLSPRTRPNAYLFCRQYQPQLPLPQHYLRMQSTASATQQEDAPDSQDLLEDDASNPMRFPSPPPNLATKSSRLNALHARLSLSPRLPVQTLARCLVHPSADPNPHFNNASLSILGKDILGYYTSEAILCRYPRLPTEVMFSAMWAFCGSRTLALIAHEWGVEFAAAPGGEVDSGLLQFARQEAGNAGVNGTGIQVKELQGKQEGRSVNRPGGDIKGWRRGASSKTVYDDYFGNEITSSSTTSANPNASSTQNQTAENGITLEDASTSFVRALFGALYLHTGLPLTKAFYTSHILSRNLNYSSLFSFRQPTRDLARLCAREDFLPPVARIIAETGRESRHPVFVVGIFSGREKLGEGSGGSLDEARIRAAINALKGWYLYSPLEVVVPSQARRGQKFPGVMIDGGEVIV